MKYSPAPAPQNTEDIPRYIYSEVRKIQQVLDLVDSSAQYVRVESVDNDFAMGEWSNVVFVDASGTAPTVTLPTPFEGRKVSVKNVTGGNAVTVMQKGSETVEGASSYALSNTADAVTLVCDETPNWHVI